MNYGPFLMLFAALATRFSTPVILRVEHMAIESWPAYSGTIKIVALWVGMLPILALLAWVIGLHMRLARLGSAERMLQECEGNASVDVSSEFEHDPQISMGANRAGFIAEEPSINGAHTRVEMS